MKVDVPDEEGPQHPLDGDLYFEDATVPLGAMGRVLDRHEGFAHGLSLGHHVPIHDAVVSRLLEPAPYPPS